MSMIDVSFLLSCTFELEWIALLLFAMLLKEILIYYYAILALKLYKSRSALDC